MKLNITDDKNREITGYTNINLLSNTYLSEVSELSDFSCEDIIVSEHINVLSEKECVELFAILCRKLALNGEISITIYDVECICTFVDKEKHLNAILPKINSCITAGELKQIVNSYDIYISSLSSSNGLLNLVGVKAINETNE